MPPDSSGSGVRRSYWISNTHREGGDSESPPSLDRRLRSSGRRSTDGRASYSVAKKYMAIGLVAVNIVYLVTQLFLGARNCI